MSNFESIYRFYCETISLGTSTYESDPRKLALPIVPFPALRDLLHSAARIFAKEPTLLTITQDLVIVGDIHGQILDLFRILAHFGHPPSTKYLFLGDLVDRGAFSTETAIFLLTMKVLWPTAISMIRGNHEFAQLWRTGGFEAELDALYPNMGAPGEFLKTFAVMPLAAVVNGGILCLHGGIGPDVKSIEAISRIPRPVPESDLDVVFDILWSDPSDAIDYFEPSNRGTGHLFGKEAIAQFLEENGFQLLIRGHECEDEGFAWHLEGKVLTVFSASGYCNMAANKAGVVVARKNSKQPITMNFPVLKWIFREDAQFLNGADQGGTLMWDRSKMAEIREGSKLPMLAERAATIRSGSKLATSKSDGSFVVKPRLTKDLRGSAPTRITVASPLARVAVGVSQSVRVLPFVARGAIGDDL